MEKKLTLKELEQLFQDAHKKQNNLEQKINDNQSKLDNLMKTMEDDLKELKDTQYNLHCLKEQIHEARKLYIKNVLNIKTIKNNLKDKLPIINKVKTVFEEKKKEIKEYVDGTSANNKWLDERYDEYVSASISKGEQVKTKEDFSKIALTLKEVHEENTGISLPKIINKVSKKYDNAKEGINSVYISLGLDKNKEFNHSVQDIDNISQKNKILLEWIQYNKFTRYNIVYKDINDLYDEYVLYVRHIYGIANAENLIFKNEGDIFKNALSSHLEDFS